MVSLWNTRSSFQPPGVVRRRVLQLHAEGLASWSIQSFAADSCQAETFHTKPWFEADEKAHGYDGPLHTEPHDLAPISQLLLKSMEDKGLPLVHDMFSNGETSNGCGHAPRTGK